MPWPWVTKTSTTTETLRLDLAIQTALGRTEELASSPTLCRWENRADRENCWAHA